jgi:hypothetical protein
LIRRVPSLPRTRSRRPAAATFGELDGDVGQRNDGEPDDLALDGDLVALLEKPLVDAVTVARRLLRLFEARGSTAWTSLERIPPVESFRCV